MLGWNPAYNWTRAEYDNVVRGALCRDGKESVVIDVEHSDRQNMDDLMRWAAKDGFVAEELDMDTIRISRKQERQ